MGTQTIRVLLADDHRVLREGMRNLLEREPDIVVVGEAGNGLEAVEQAKATAPDVVLMDVVMPRLSGIEATKLIKRVAPATAVLILTAYDDDHYVMGLLEAGAAGYLLKNAAGQEIVQAIRAVCAGEVVLDPPVLAKLLARAAQTPVRSAAQPGDGLTARELEVLGLAAEGRSNKEIAAGLSLSVPTVKAHLVNIFNKMQVGSRTEAVMRAVSQGLIQMKGAPAEAGYGGKGDQPHEGRRRSGPKGQEEAPAASP